MLLLGREAGPGYREHLYLRQNVLFSTRGAGKQINGVEKTRIKIHVVMEPTILFLTQISPCWGPP